MVVVRMPPPIGSIVASYVNIPSGEELIRIFDPSQHGNSATGFRNYGLISRSDYHRQYSDNIDRDRI